MVLATDLVRFGRHEICSWASLLLETFSFCLIQVRIMSIYDIYGDVELRECSRTGEL